MKSALGTVVEEALLKWCAQPSSGVPVWAVELKSAAIKLAIKSYEHTIQSK